VAVGLFLIVLFWSCASVPGLREESITTFIRVPFVRVLLDENKVGVQLSGDGSYAIECLTGPEQAVYYSSQKIRVENRGGLLRVVNIKGDPVAEDLDEVNIIPRGRGNRIRVGDRRYRGIMKVLPHGQNARLVNIVYMEDYLKGVVPPEIGERSEDEAEAVRAQAVAARTYAMSHLQQYQHEPFDVKSSIIDQLYEGVNAEVKLVNRAIESTAGLVLTYNDEMIDAYYHSTCGGMTDDIVDVWDRQEVAYLKPVVDDACAWSKYYNWQEEFTEPQLRGRIEQYLSADRGRELRIGRITNVVVRERSAGGRATLLAVHTETDVFRFRKDRIRWVIRRTSNPDLILPSANLEVDLKRDSQGNLTKVIFRGAGYGHGVGMCQCGAIGRARQGWAFDEILTYFYSGVDLKKLY
jgi:stage II sporulation protein D